MQTGRVNGASERGQERSSMSGQWGRRPEQLAYRFGRQTESHGNLLSRRLAAHHVPQVPAVRKIVLKTAMVATDGLPSSFTGFCREHDLTWAERRIPLPLSTHVQPCSMD